MANPPVPLQPNFMSSNNSGPPRMPVAPPVRHPLQTPVQGQSVPPGMMPINMDDGANRRKGRGRGKKLMTPEKVGPDVMPGERMQHDQPPVIGGNSVIRGMLQAPQQQQQQPFAGKYQQFTPRPRMPFSPSMQSQHRIQRPSQPMFRSTHHPMDPSPSGGGPINIQNIKQEPSTIPVIAPTNNSQGGSGKSTPPSSYHRPQAPQTNTSMRYPAPESGSRHSQHSLPFPSSQQTSGPRPQQGNYGGYQSQQPPPPPNYHYGNYPAPLTNEDTLPSAAYQNMQYAEQYVDSNSVLDANSSKLYDEEGSGEFGGLVSYFSSQREDDLDT